MTLVCRDRPCHMFIVIHCFGTHCICHLQSECVEVRGFWKPYIGQAVSGEWDWMVLIGGVE